MAKTTKTVNKKTKTVKPKDIEEVGENLNSIVENSQNTFKSKFETLAKDIIKALPAGFKSTMPADFTLDSSSIPYLLTLEIPYYSERLYWVERLTVRITWNTTATGNISKAVPVKFTLI